MKLTKNHYVHKDDITSRYIYDRVVGKFKENGFGTLEGFGTYEKISLQQNEALGVDDSDNTLIWSSDYDLEGKQRVSISELFADESYSLSKQCPETLPIELTPREVFYLHNVLSHVNGGIGESLAYKMESHLDKYFGFDFCEDKSLEVYVDIPNLDISDLDEDVNQLFDNILNRSKQSQEKDKKIKELRNKIAELSDELEELESK